MKTKILTTLFCLLCIGLVSLNAQDEPKKEEVKKIVIVKKTVDENGNEKVERIVKEGEAADEHIKEIKVDGDGEKKKVKIKVKKDGEENIWISDDNEVIDLEGKKYEFRSGDSNVKSERKIKIVTKDDNGVEDVIEWSGEGEMPEELKKKLEEKGVNMKSIDGGKGMFFFHKDGEEGGKHHIDIEIDDVEGMTPEMKAKFKKLHKEGDHHGNVWVDKTKMNTNKAFLGVNIENTEEGTVKVISTIEGSAAEEAGIQAGDIIVDVSGKKVSTVDELIDALSPYKPGDDVSINLNREGKATQVKAVLKERTDVSFNDDVEKDIEVIVISDCNTDFSGDEDVDFIFKSIGDDGEVKEITKEITVIMEGEDGEMEKEVEIEVTVEGSEDVIEEDEVIVEKNVVEKEDNVLDTEALKNMERLELNNFKAFPNPTDGVLNLEFNGEKGAIQVMIVDINGREVYKNVNNNFDGYFSDRVNFEGMAKGNYVIYILQEGKVFTDNIVYN